MEKPTPASPPLHNRAHHWSPHSPATLISIIWQNENTYSFLSYLCCFAFQLPSKHCSRCTNPALRILFSPSHRYYPQFSPNSSVERTIWWSAAQMHVSCLLHLFSVIQPLPDTAAGTDTFLRFLFLRRKKSQFIFKMEMTIGREGNHLAL